MASAASAGARLQIQNFAAGVSARRITVAASSFSS